MDAASLAAFRILFGLLMVFGMVRFLGKGWIDELYVKPAFFFTYDFCPWVKPLSSAGMHLLFIGLAAVSLCLAIGFCYRVASVLFLVGFTYVELIDQTTYLNHHYLIWLLGVLLVFLPAHGLWSVDAALRPAVRRATIPAGMLHLLRFQIAVVYVFAGLAKVNADWLWAAQPMRTWLAARSDLPWIGPWLNEAWVAYAASWLGAAYDLSIVFLLLHRRTRLPAWLAVVAFHLATWCLFRIGLFPWLMIISSLLFFPPDWPRRCLAWWRQRRDGRRQVSKSATIVALPRTSRAEAEPSPKRREWSWPGALAGVYVILQVALPLRSYFEEDSAWTGRGFNWAWRVMLVEKSGTAEFRVVNLHTGWRQRVRLTDYVTPRQASFVAQDPSLLRALAQHVAADYQARGQGPVRIYCDAYASLNGRPVQRLMDPDVDLAATIPDKEFPQAVRALNP